MSLLIGIISLIFSLSNNLSLLRIVFGHLFVFIFSGLPLSRLFITKTNFLERLASSTLFSVLLTYPTSVIITLIEGQSGQAIFSRHLTLSMTILLVLSQLISYLLNKALKLSSWKPSKSQISVSISPLLLFSLFVYSIFAFTHLNQADIYGDEYDLGYQAYNLVNGIKAGRRAFVISYDMHPPLTTSLKHFSLNLLTPTGLDHLQDWQFRFSEGLIGLLTIIAVYLLTYEFFSPTTANLSALFLSVNNYFVWIGRIYHREMVLTFMFTLTAYYLLKTIRSSSFYPMLGFSFAAALLSKETAVILLPLLLLSGFFRRRIYKSLIISIILFSPVLIFNLFAYLTTGYADIFFSNILGLHHVGSTPRSSDGLVTNFISLITYLIDLYSPLVFIAFLISLIHGFSISVLPVLTRRNVDPQQRLKKLTESETASIKNTPPEPGILISSPHLLKSSSVLIFWVLMSTIFFTFTALRSYYFVIFAPPLIILLAIFLTELRPQVLKIILTLACLFASAYYSYKTNLARTDLTSPIPPDIDGNMIIHHPLNQFYSTAVLGWTYQWGYKNLVSYLDSHPQLFNCLNFDKSFDPLVARRYFWAEDTVKQYYLNDYPHRFPVCSSNPSSHQLLLSKASISSSSATTIPNNPLFPHLYLYQLN